MNSLKAAKLFRPIEPNAHGDWLKQRGEAFTQYIAMGTKDGGSRATLFANYSNGVKTQRDAWCYNASRSAVAANMANMIDAFNTEAERFSHAHPSLNKALREAAIDAFIDTDANKIAWTHSLKQDLINDKRVKFDDTCLVQGCYRPFTKHWLYFNRRLNERVYQIPRFFPDATSKNIVIGVSASDSRSAYSVFITDQVPSLHAVDMVGSQYFPLYVYDDPIAPSTSEPSRQTPMFGEAKLAATPQVFKRRDAITAEGLAHFQSAYPGEPVSREDIFYYVYGLLHAPDYRERFADNLGKELPRIPCVKSAQDFRAFSDAGRQLARLHLYYEAAPMFAATVDGDDMTKPPGLSASDYRVEKMRFGKSGLGKDITTIHYNQRISVMDIPAEAYDYVVNGKPAIEWVMDRQVVKTDKASGLINDANDWAVETMGNARYPLELLLRVVTVSLESMKLVRRLPALDI
jgi:predicted helicase